MKNTNSSYTMIFALLFALTSITLFTPIQGYTALPLTDDNESPFAKVYEKVAPSVVLIEVESSAAAQRQAPPRMFDRFFNIPNPPQKGQPKRPRPGMGSGVIIDREGHILTNNHVIENADNITVKLSKNEEYEAEVIGMDPQTDLAVIKIDFDGKLLPAEYVAEFGDSDKLKPGDYAIAIGNPIGFERTITVGVISGLGRHGLQVFGAQSLRLQNFIQTDAQINPGNSGGALADINGKVIGINNMYTAQYAAIGFAIPINLAKRVAAQLIKSGEVKRGFVGIQVPPGKSSDITSEIMDTMNLPGTDGVLVIEVTTGSPAEKAGLKPDDVILTLDSKPVKDFHDFQLMITEHFPGDTVRLGIIREGKEKNITLTLADLDEFLKVAASERGSVNSWLGINVVDLNSQMAQQYDIEDIETGVVVVKIDESTPASESNLLAGDIIIEIQDRSVKNIEDFNNIKKEFADSRKPVLIYRLRKTSGGGIVKGYVAIKQTIE